VIDRRVLLSAVGVAAGGVALGSGCAAPGPADWHVVLTRLANGLPTTDAAVAAAAAHPAPQLLVGIPLTVPEAADLRSRRGDLPGYDPVFRQLRRRTPTLTSLTQGYRPPSVRTLHAWLTAPERAVVEQLRRLVRGRVPVEIRLTRWTSHDLDRQYAALIARMAGLTTEQGIEFSSIGEGVSDPVREGPVISVMTPRPLDAAQRRAVRQVAPAAVFSVGTVSPASGA
jgi:hypothetical protein